jgi:hypothetical protein
MMMTHRIVLKTHPLSATHVRTVHSILFRSGLQTTKRPEGRPVDGHRPSLNPSTSSILLAESLQQVPLTVS